MKNKITIITPVFNGEKYIEKCILSVLNQTYKNIEHIVINDGSSDNTKTICEKYNNKIKLINKKNEGVSKARNFGLKEATGDYILFVDADDWLEETMCEKLISSAEKNDSDIVVCGFFNYYENTKVSEPVNLVEDNKLNFLELITCASSNFGGFPWNKLIKKEVIKNKFNEEIHYYENLLFFLENCTNKTKYSVVNECLYNYCINDTSAVHSKKYNIKKLTSLNSLKLVIELLPERSIISHKMAFINSYYNNLYEIKKNYKNNLSDIYCFNDLLNTFYSDVINSSDVSFKSKIKIFCMKNLNIIYTFYKKLKG